MTTRRIFHSIFATALFFSMFLFVIAPTSAAITAESGNLDQWDRVGKDWQNGNLGKDIYSEGRVVPFRVAFENLAPGTTYVIEMSHDVTKGGNVGYDFLADYNFTEPDVDLCGTPAAGGASSLCSLPGGLASAPFPAVKTQFNYTAPFTFTSPPHLAGLTIQGAIAQNVTLANANLTTWGAKTVTIDPIVYSGSTSADSSAKHTINVTTPDTCTAGKCAVFFAFGGRLATSSYWRTSTGAPNGAGAITGSAYHVNLLTFGNQDMSIKTGSDLLTFLEVIKDLNSTETPGITGRFNLWVQQGTGTADMKAENVGDLGTTGPVIYTISDLTSFTVYETAYTGTDLSWYWKKVKCFDRFGGASPIASTPDYYSLGTLTFDISPGQDVYCVIENLDIPTAVAVMNGKAVAGDGKVTVSWETAPFADTLGFIVFRDGAPVSGLVTSPDGAGSYQFVDSGLKAGTYEYAIFEVGNEKEALAIDAVTVYSYLKLPIIIR